MRLADAEEDLLKCLFLGVAKCYIIGHNCLKMNEFVRIAPFRKPKPS
jgi:hypothetical protein